MKIPCKYLIKTYYKYFNDKNRDKSRDNINLVYLKSLITECDLNGLLETNEINKKTHDFINDLIKD